jgi:hypothetical protein
MNRIALAGAVIVMAAIAVVVFGGVAIHELDYASARPYAYGPAKVIAWGAAAGALLSLAVGLLGYAALRSDRSYRLSSARLCRPAREPRSVAVASVTQSPVADPGRRRRAATPKADPTPAPEGDTASSMRLRS